MTTHPQPRSSRASHGDPEAPLLAGRTMLVAGGSGNVGRHLVSALLRAGARVIVPSRSARKLEEARTVHAETSNGRLVPVLGDITDEEDGPRILREALEPDETLDGAVASLGAFAPTESVLSASRAELSAVLDGYLMAHFGAARNLVPVLRASGGTYTFIQGPLAFDVWSPQASLVSIATAAQAMLARAVMKEQEPDPEQDPRVRVNELVLHSAVGWGEADKSSPVSPEDIGRYVARLMSPAAVDVHGRTIHLESPDQLDELSPEL